MQPRRALAWQEQCEQGQRSSRWRRGGWVRVWCTGQPEVMSHGVMGGEKRQALACCLLAPDNFRAKQCH